MTTATALLIQILIGKFHHLVTSVKALIIIWAAYGAGKHFIT